MAVRISFRRSSTFCLASVCLFPWASWSASKASRSSGSFCVLQVVPLAWWPVASCERRCPWAAPRRKHGLGEAVGGGAWPSRRAAPRGRGHATASASTAGRSMVRLQTASKPTKTAAPPRRAHRRADHIPPLLFHAHRRPKGWVPPSPLNELPACPRAIHLSTVPARPLESNHGALGGLMKTGTGSATPCTATLM